MAVDQLHVKVADVVCERFIRGSVGTPRKPLVLVLKDSFKLDEMVRMSLLGDDDRRKLYFPTLGTFALLPDDDPKFLSAKLGTIQLLHTLRNLYEVEDEDVTIKPSELFHAVCKRFDEVDQHVFNLGLYLVKFPGLSAVQQSTRDATEPSGIGWLTISERIMTVDDPETTWKKCVEVSRRNAEGLSAFTQVALDVPKPPNSTPNPANVKQKPWIPSGWELGKQIGEGGQGWTYKIRRTAGDEAEWFVFKRMKNANRADRFHSEIAALRVLDHPGTLRIIEDGTVKNTPYYIAEFCSGGDLSRRNLRGMPLLEKLLFFRQVCSAVAAAHAAKIIHRDIKPSNILVRSDGSAVVGDFGLCLHLDGEDRVTMTEEAVGARNYMAPELEDGRRDDVTPAADIYSLGKLLYFLVTGKSFSREKHRDAAYDLTLVDHGRPDNGIRFIYELLDRSIVEVPASRFTDASEMVAAIDGAVRRIILDAHVLDMGAVQRCLYCIEGEYIPYQGQRDATRMLLVCRRCGNTQNFTPPFNGWGEWWMR